MVGALPVQACKCKSKSKCSKDLATIPMIRGTPYTGVKFGSLHPNNAISHDFAISLLNPRLPFGTLQSLYQACYGKPTIGEPNNRLQFAGPSPSLPEQTFTSGLAAQQCERRALAKEDGRSSEAAGFGKQWTCVCTSACCAYPQSKAQLALRREPSRGKRELWTPVYCG